MSQRIEKNLPLLQLLCNCNKSQRKALIETLDKEQLLAICECVENVLDGHVPLDEKAYSEISKQRDKFRLVRRRTPTQKAKKEALVQTGGALPALLIPALSLAASILGNIIR